MKLCECGCGQPAPIAKKTQRSQGAIAGVPQRFVKGHSTRGRPMSEAARARHRVGAKRGADHYAWKGTEATYYSLHNWLQRGKPRTGICAHCGAQPEPFKGMKVGTHWANVSGEYRRDFDDYIELCKLCHNEFDKGGLRPWRRSFS